MVRRIKDEHGDVGFHPDEDYGVEHQDTGEATLPNSKISRTIYKA